MGISGLSARVRWGSAPTRIGLLAATPFLVAVSYAVFGNPVSASDLASATQAAASGGQLAGSSACAECHREIYDKFSRTGMGRSMYRVTPDLLKTMRSSGSIESQNPNLKLEVYARDGKLYQTEYETGEDGKEIFRDTHEVEWIVGAGENGFGGLVRRDDFLFQAPLSFYSKPQSWGLSPGYEFGNYGFNRPILPACISCHSGRPNAIFEGNGRFENPPFVELAIGCENCHGPGLAHVVAMHTDSESFQGHDA